MEQSTLELIKSKPTYGELTLTGNWEYREVGKQGRNRIYVETLCSCNSIQYTLLLTLKAGRSTIKPRKI